VAEDSAFLLPSAAALTVSYRRLKCPTAIIARRDASRRCGCRWRCRTPPWRSCRRPGTWCIISWRMRL
jgi:hypothetical protein